MKFIVLAMSLITTLVFAQEVPKSFALVPAVQKTAIVNGKKYHITRDSNNKFVFIKYEDEKKGFSVKPIIVTVTPATPENNQK